MLRQYSRYTVRWQGLILSICLLALALACAPRAARAAAPTLTLTPDRGPCTTQITLRGEGFPAGRIVNLIAGAEGDGVAVHFASPAVAADGTLALQADMRRIEGGCGVSGGHQFPAGTRYRFIATTDEPSSQLLATAFFTLAPSSSGTPGLPNTGGGGMAAQDSQAWGLFGGFAFAVGLELVSVTIRRRRTN